MNQRYTKLILIATFFLLLPVVTKADYAGQKVNFYIDKDYDLSGRDQFVAILQKVTDKLYFYIDDEWWNSLSNQKRDETIQALASISSEFEQNIYPNLTSNFGSEWSPGIDKDAKITVLIHPMIDEARGYFNSGDEYHRAQSPKSNEREMVYLNSKYLGSSRIKSFFAHEFMHLITFNQKEKQGQEEEIWLNEARSEYVLTLLGYDDEYKGSNLERRVKSFLDKPTDSLTEWQNTKNDYGIVNLFTQYLIDHYGKEILVDSLQSKKVGIPSINHALEKRGFEEDFSQIFSDWTIAVLVNDCNIGPKYCYLNQNLKNLRIVPQTNFLPRFGDSSLSILNITKNWSANWHKIIGGKGTLTFEFDGQDEVNFKVPYLLCDIKEKCSVEILTLDNEQKGSITLLKFDENYSFLTIVPLIGDKVSGFDGLEPNYLFSWKASAVAKTKEELEKEERERLLAQIEFLKKQIAALQAQIDAILGKKTTCQKIENNLYFGIMNNSEVSCLQQFLKNQGLEIYPEGLITGNFLLLTKNAVVRFQEKYADEILTPLRLNEGTGFVGEKTRVKINQLLKK